VSVLIAADYSQIEARLAAWTAAGKPRVWEDVDPEGARMLWAFHQRREIYMEQAAQGIYGDWRKWQRITKDERQIMGKVPVLSMLYGISATGRDGNGGLRGYAWNEYEIDWSKREATRIWLGFHKLWPEFKRWHEREERVLRARGWTSTAIGRLRRLPEATGYGKPASEAVGAGINAPIQGLASDLTQMALVILDEHNIPVVGDIHDELLIEAPTGTNLVLLEKVLRRVMEREVLKRLEPLGLHLPPGLIEIEVKCGAWGEGKPVNDRSMLVKTG
jgi:DNA polymerase I-like protein with 3'-5' exonuclease and polymerase domains